MIPENIKSTIDNLTFIEMFRKWRFAPVGDPMFQGEVGNYFSKVMQEKRAKLLPGEYSKISKAIGW